MFFISALYLFAKVHALAVRVYQWHLLVVFIILCYSSLHGVSLKDMCTSLHVATLAKLVSLSMFRLILQC
jgi:hypothetical protein